MTEIFRPKVSIVIPVYNGSNYIHESIESALSQTYDNLEVIVVNDGSSDNGKTEKIVLSYGDRVRYYYKKNGGVSSALNYGIKMMSGDYFSWLSHDDKYTPNKVKDSVELLRKQNVYNRELLIAFTSGYYIDSDSKYIKRFPKHFDANTIYNGVDVIAKMLKKKMLNGCCMLIPRKAFERCGYFDETLRYNQDALMWYRIFSNGYQLITDNKQNVMYRLHRNQTSKLRRDLYLHDTIQSSEILMPLFARYSSEDNPLLYLYARRVAISNCLKAVDMCIEYGRAKKIFNFYDITKIRSFAVYGCFRNMLKSLRNRVLK